MSTNFIRNLDQVNSIEIIIISHSPFFKLLLLNYFIKLRKVKLSYPTSFSLHTTSLPQFCFGKWFCNVCPI